MVIVKQNDTNKQAYDDTGMTVMYLTLDGDAL
jgi:hypothetical protein